MEERAPNGSAPRFPGDDRRVTLTVLTGIGAGLCVTLDGTPIIVGRSVDADLVLDDPGVNDHHARVAQTAEGTFYVEDLASTTGTFLRSNLVGVALLHGGDVLRLGPSARLRFAIIGSLLESILESVLAPGS
jgi:pSer/pThr/pTyr-binding forkhead associated (FHA) protein